MSYILEAIRRADRERKLGQAPQADQLSQADVSTEKRPPWFWIVCLNVTAIAIFTAWLLTRSTGTEVVATKPQAVPEDVSVASAAVEEQVVATWDEPYVPPYETEEESPQVIEAVQPEPVVAQSETESTEPPQAPANAPSIERSLAPNAAPAPSAAPASRPAPVAAAPESTTPPEPNSSNSGSESLPKLRDLPIETRKRIPDLQVNTHFYSENVRRRFVILNLEKYREGDQLNEGLDVIAIRRDGIVLEYQGERFLLPR